MVPIVSILKTKIFENQKKAAELQEKKERKKIMLEKLIAIIEEQLNVEGMEITEDSRFKEDMSVDSLDLFEKALAIEEEFHVEIPSEDLEKITTVGSVIEYLKSKGVEA